MKESWEVVFWDFTVAKRNGLNLHRIETIKGVVSSHIWFLISTPSPHVCRPDAGWRVSYTCFAGVVTSFFEM